MQDYRAYRSPIAIRPSQRSSHDDHKSPRIPWVIGKKVCPEPNRNPCDKGRLHAGHSIAQQCP
ncbi:MAG: hypothetical protein E6236_07080, partial [Eggerthella sp.]|uniref:hypothetical protein n=1 Tax=Eggerthella sp. TaxID=1929886 RepID=UPI002912E825